MPAAIVELISNDDCRPPKQRVEWISDLYFTPQIPGIMRSHRMKGQKNWGCIASLIETCKLHGLDPQAYLTDVLTTLVNNWPNRRLGELLPWA